jgi:hypothetical protein
MTTAQPNGSHPGGVDALESRTGRVGRGPVRGRLLGELLLAEGLVTETQLDAALRAQAARADGTPIGQILVEQGALTPAALDVVLARYHKKYRLGDLLVGTNVITETQLQLAIDHHRRTGLRLGDALVQLDFLTEEELKHALCTQLGMDFVDLDRLVVDATLAVVIPKTYAQHHRLAPVAKTDGVLTVALADPTDWWLGEELQASTGCRVHLVTSTDAAFQRAFARVYGEEPAVGLARQHQRLEQAHALLSRELDAAVRALNELRQAQDGLITEQGEALRLAAEQSLRQEIQARALADLKAAHAALREEHEARSAAYAELSRAQAGTVEALAALRAEHARLLEEHRSTARALGEERERGAQLARALAELEAAHVIARREIDERLAAITALDAAYAEATRGLATLRAAHDALVVEHDRVVSELAERADTAETRQRLAVDQLEALLARLRA